MSSATAKYALPYAVAGDAVNQEPVTMKALADRLDLMLGESGVWVPTLVANTPITLAITLARTYPGNATTQPSGIVVVNSGNTVGASQTFSSWVLGWTGTATTITGFTLGVQSTQAGARNIVWRFLPVL